MSKFLKVIVNLFLVCAILIAGAILVPPVLGVSTTMVDSASMDTNLPIGSVTYSQEVSVADIAVGDKILVESDTMAYAYIVESADAGDGNYIVTDANNQQAESEEIALRNVALKLILTIPLIGYVMIAMRSVEGLIIIGLVVLFVVILFILSELWKKTDDEEEEDENEEKEDEEQEPEGKPVIQTAEAEPVQNEFVELTTELTPEELARSIAEVQSAEEETEPELVQETIQEPEQGTISEPVESEMEEAEQEVSDSEEAVEDTDDSFVPVARPSKEEILKKAKEAGEEPTVIEYDNVDVTIIDYSDLL